VNGTRVLSISETIEEVQDTGFLSWAAAPMLAVQQIGANALLQVHPQEIHHVLADRRVNERRVPQGKTIITVMTNKRQVTVVVAPTRSKALLLLVHRKSRRSHPSLFLPAQRTVTQVLVLVVQQSTLVAVVRSELC
jgi:predicted aspartyl protease